MTQIAHLSKSLVRAANLTELQTKGQLLVHLNNQTIALFYVDGQMYAIDNRCPHMGFPLHSPVRAKLT